MTKEAIVTAGGHRGDASPEKDQPRADELRRTWICADDYGISPAVSAAIRDLVGRGRLNATSVMTTAPSFSPAEAEALASLNSAGRRVAIGLHVTLTAPFRPLSASFRPLHGGAFPPLGSMMGLAAFRRVDRAALAAEITAQLAAFSAAFGRLPDFIDGHQHVHLLPQVRDEVVGTTRRVAPAAWLRQCGSARPVKDRLDDRKGLFIDWLSRGLRPRAAALGIAVNPAFAGTYDFREDADFARLFPQFLDRLPDGGLIACHPGRVDPELERLDPLTTLREKEYDYLAGDDFRKVLAAHRATLA